MQAHGGNVHRRHGVHRVGQRVGQVQARLQLRFGVQQLAVVRMLHSHAHHVRIATLLVLLALLGAAVLEPDLNLALRQRQRLGELALPPDGDVAGGAVLLLQLQALEVGVHHAVLILGAGFACKRDERYVS